MVLLYLVQYKKRVPSSLHFFFFSSFIYRLFFCVETPGRDIFFLMVLYFFRMGPSTSQCCGLPVAKKQGDMARHKHKKTKNASGESQWFY
jgi:hypothetical protein